MKPCLPNMGIDYSFEDTTKCLFHNLLLNTENVWYITGCSNISVKCSIIYSTECTPLTKLKGFVQIHSEQEVCKQILEQTRIWLPYTHQHLNKHTHTRTLTGLVAPKAVLTLLMNAFTLILRHLIGTINKLSMNHVHKCST